MKNIFFLVRSLNVETGGGSHFNALEQIRALKSIGFKVSIHTFTNKNNNFPNSIDVIEHDLGGSFVSEQFKLCSLIKEYENEYDLFFLYGVDFVWGAGRYKKDDGNKKVFVYLDTYLPSMFILSEHSLIHRIKRLLWDRIIGLRLAKRVDTLFAVSPWLQKRYEKFGFPPSQFILLPNFLDLSTYDECNSIKHKKTIPELLYTGRITEDKGVDLLIMSLSELQNIEWNLTLVGDGEMKEEVKRLVYSLRLGSRVTFIPWISQESLKDVYRGADIFVHPARWPEPFGRTVVEALSNGLPVIVPEEGGSAWIAGEAGYSFKNGNQKSLTSVLRDAINDFYGGDSTKLSKARKRSNVFILEKNIDNLCKIFKKIT